jgi:hypothetical protein
VEALLMLGKNPWRPRYVIENGKPPVRISSKRKPEVNRI